MRLAALAAALSLAVPAALAQAPQAPAAPAPAAEAATPLPKIEPHRCEPKPVFPGAKGIRIAAQRKEYEDNLGKYEACMKAYVAARKDAIRANSDSGKAAEAEFRAIIAKHEAAIKANNDALQAAVDEFNGIMEKLRKEIEAAKAAE